MLRRNYLRSGALLFLAVLAGGAFLAIPIVGVPAAVMLRGFLLGIVGGVFGACLFAAGYTLAREREAEEERTTVADTRTPAVRSTAEAKYWLRKFLEEHRVTEQGRDQDPPRPDAPVSNRSGRERSHPDLP